MGYTNYWTILKPENHPDDNWVPKDFPEQLRADIKKLVRTAKAKGIPVVLRHCSSHTITIEDGGPDPYEAFEISYRKTEMYSGSKARFGIDSFLFCKTARHPYDAVVKAALMLLEKYCIVSEWSFDGDKTEIEFRNAYHLLEDAELVGH